MHDFLAVPDHRRAALVEVIDVLDRAATVALTTHVNADGDGAGSEAALAAWLLGRGSGQHRQSHRVPRRFAYLLPEPWSPGAGRPSWTPGCGPPTWSWSWTPASPAGSDAWPSTCPMGGSWCWTTTRPPRAASPDPASGTPPPAPPASSSTTSSPSPAIGWLPAMVQGVYVAIETDTGSFRFSNTTPRAHAIAADLLSLGVDPESVYRRLHATVPLERIRDDPAGPRQPRDRPRPAHHLDHRPREVTHEMGATPTTWTAWPSTPATWKAPRSPSPFARPATAPPRSPSDPMATSMSTPSPGSSAAAATSRRPAPSSADPWKPTALASWTPSDGPSRTPSLGSDQRELP
jgi:hypothetical protein